MGTTKKSINNQMIIGKKPKRSQSAAKGLTLASLSHRKKDKKYEEVAREHYMCVAPL